MIILRNQNLQLLLNQYDQKRTQKIEQADYRKKELYDSIPRFQEIDMQISKIAIASMKQLLSSKDSKVYTDLQNKINTLKEEKKMLLEQSGKKENYFFPEFECAKCEDTGYLNTPTGSIMCHCLKQKLYNMEYNLSNIYDIKNQTFNEFDLSYYSDKVDKNKYGFEFSPRENISNIKKIAQKFIEDFGNKSENNLLFTGTTGLGKTFLSSCIANELIQSGKTVLYQTSPVMLDSIIDARFGKPNSNPNILQNILSVDLLIIDDLGTETVNSIKSTELFNIINSRLLNQNDRITKTIISTNLSLQELYHLYDERIVSRIVGNYTTCLFFGDDIRLFQRSIKK